MILDNICELILLIYQVLILESNLAFTLFEDALLPNDTRLSADTVLTTVQLR